MVGLEVGQGEHRARVPVHAGDDVGRDRAFQQGARARGGEGLKRPGVGGVLQDVAGLHLGPVGLGEIGADVGGAGLRQREGGFGRQPRADHEAIRRQGLGGAEQLLPGQPAMLLMGQAQHGDGPGRPSRLAAEDGLEERHGLAVRLQEEAGGRRGGGGLAAVIGGQPMGPAVVIEQESPAPEARTLRLDQAQHRLDGHRRVDGAAAALQHLASGIRGQWIGRHHHPVGVEVRGGHGRGDGETGV